MLRKLHIVFTFLLVSTLGLAQQHFQWSHYMLAPTLMNPAAGGSDGLRLAQLGHRQQWTGFPGSPVTTFASVYWPIARKEKPNMHDKWIPLKVIGGQVYQDSTGPIKRNSVAVSYAYNFAIHKSWRLAFSAQIGLLSHKIDYSRLIFEEVGESYNDSQQSRITGAAGFWLYSQHTFIGLSATQLFQQGGTRFSNQAEAQQGITVVPHYFVTAGHQFPINESAQFGGNHSLFLVPSMLMKYAGQRTRPSYDVNIKLKSDNKFWVGGSYRLGEGMTLLGGVTIPFGLSILEVGYAYDFPYTAIRSHTGGTHEITLSCKWRGKYDIQCPSSFW